MILADRFDRLTFSQVIRSRCTVAPLRKNIPAARMNQRFWLLLLVGLVFIAGCSSPAGPLKFSGATMGTGYTITIVHAPESLTAEKAQSRVAKVLDKVNARMSTYRQDSELSRLNQASANTWVPVSSELLALLKQSVNISALSNGAFDVTVGPLVNLWGFGPDKHRDAVPDESKIKQRMALTGMDKLIFRDTPPAVRKSKAGVYVDLSGIAKGYGVDQVAAALSALGATDFLVDIGGELYGEGKNERGQPWQIAIERPDIGQAGVELVARLQGHGMATSGDYRNYFEFKGKRYSHTINPRTGRPVTHNLREVTVVAPTTARADGLATALLVLGPTAGFELAEREKIAALFIIGGDGEYTQRMTKQFTPFVSNTK